MLGLFPDLFRTSLIVHGVAESHPAAVLDSTLNTLGIQFEGEAADGLIDTEFLSEMARDIRVEERYWDFWKDMVVNVSKDQNLAKWALDRISQAERTSLEERKMVYGIRPKKLYIEGCSKYPSSVIGLVAKHAGADVVYLDEGFAPYEKWQENRFKADLSYVQKGREAHWTKRVGKNKPHGTSLLIAGRNHLIRPSEESVVQEPSRVFIGNFPNLLKDKGINFLMYADLTVSGTGAAPKLYSV
ncbi:MAG: hypothetical protein HYT71_01580 [Candidatus Aenigmarchaeota archaeon]|nr:hypothetical protein [Candidatus Aenigmarchaeota archaeon]